MNSWTAAMCFAKKASSSSSTEAAKKRALEAAAAAKKKKAAAAGRGAFDPLNMTGGASDTIKKMRQMLFVAEPSYLLNAQLVRENPEEFKRRFIIESAVKLYKAARETESALAEKKLVASQTKAMDKLKAVSEGLWREAARPDYAFPPLHRRPMTKTLPARPLYADHKFID